MRDFWRDRPAIREYRRAVPGKPVMVDSHPHSDVDDYPPSSKSWPDAGKTAGLSAAIVVENPDTIERSMGKMRRIIDNRPR